MWYLKSEVFSNVFAANLKLLAAKENISINFEDVEKDYSFLCNLNDTFINYINNLFILQTERDKILYIYLYNTLKAKNTYKDFKKNILNIIQDSYQNSENNSKTLKEVKKTLFNRYIIVMFNDILKSINSDFLITDPSLQYEYHIYNYKTKFSKFMKENFQPENINDKIYILFWYFYILKSTNDKPFNSDFLNIFNDLINESKLDLIYVKYCNLFLKKTNGKCKINHIKSDYTKAVKFIIQNDYIYQYITCNFEIITSRDKLFLIMLIKYILKYHSVEDDFNKFFYDAINLFEKYSASNPFISKKNILFKIFVCDLNVFNIPKNMDFDLDNFQDYYKDKVTNSKNLKDIINLFYNKFDEEKIYLLMLDYLINYCNEDLVNILEETNTYFKKLFFIRNFNDENFNETFFNNEFFESNLEFCIKFGFNKFQLRNFSNINLSNIEDEFDILSQNISWLNDKLIIHDRIDKLYILLFYYELMIENSLNRLTTLLEITDTTNTSDEQTDFLTKFVLNKINDDFYFNTCKIDTVDEYYNNFLKTLDYYNYKFIKENLNVSSIRHKLYVIDVFNKALCFDYDTEMIKHINNIKDIYLTISNT